MNIAQSKWGLGIGLTFLVFVVGMLIYLHLFASVVVPHPRHLAGVASVPNVVVCDGEVPWVTDEVVEAARVFWTNHKHPLGPTIRRHCDDMKLCSAGEKRMVSCSPGEIVISLRDQKFSEEHFGETITSSNESGEIGWGTTLFPAVLISPEDLDAPKLPKDYAKLVFAHEMGHQFGYEHVEVNLPGPFVSEPHGHLMTRRVFEQGWGDDGL